MYTINYDEPLYSDCWNYLKTIIDFVDAGDIPAAIDATWDLTSQLVGEAKGEKIWNDGEASVIAASIMSVVYDNREGEHKRFRNLANVYYFLINMCKPVTVGKKKIMPLSIYLNSLSDDHPSKGLLGVADIAPDKMRGSFYTSAVMTLRLFTNPYIANMSSKSNFRLEGLGKKENGSFYCTTRRQTDLSSAGYTIYHTGICGLIKRGEEKRRQAEGKGKCGYG